MESVEARDKPGELARSSIYQKLRADVLSCELRPGQLLQERDLVGRFKVSKSPIRDALLKLEEQGLIEILPRKGYRVRRIDLSDVRDMYGLRQLLERECTALFIDNAKADLLSALETFRSNPSGTDLVTWIEYNRAFHTFIAVNCGNARLARITKETIEQFDRLTYLSVASSDDLSLGSFVHEHGKIIDAIMDRNKRQAIAVMRDHIQSSRRRVMNSLKAASVVDREPEIQ